MTFFEALYGSQYWEISQQGKDGNKGRLNANLFLSAFIILIILDSFLVLFAIPGLYDSMTHSLTNFFGFGNGKNAGKLLAIPLMGGIYFLATRTVGSEANFKMYVDRFLKLPEAEKAKANKKLLTPFLILLGILFIASMTSLGS
jgi:hypothetical protein